MGSYSINFLSDQFKPLAAGRLRYAIENGDRRLKENDFETVHEKLMHTIVVKKDLTDFQHVHPEIKGDGVFELEKFVFPKEGKYRLYADFSPKGLNHEGHHAASIVLYQDIEVGNVTGEEPVIEAKNTDYPEGYEVNMNLEGEGLEKTVSFDIKKDGKPVTDLDNYLGALGHLVVLSKQGLEYLHAHPHSDSTEVQDGTMDFMVLFGHPGPHKAFLQFQHKGAITTAQFGLIV